MLNLALVAILMIASLGGELTPEENRHLDNLVEQNIAFEYDTINMEDIQGLMDASLIEVKIFQLFEKDCTSKADCGFYTHKVLKSGETLIELTEPDALLPYLSPDFKMQSQAEAEAFERMLDVVFPVFFSSGKDIYQEDKTWFFIREESFGEKKGVVVTVDGDGAILVIENRSEVE